jgi:TPR repeat protein
VTVAPPAPVAPSAAPAKFSADALLAYQGKCDKSMGTQFDPDLPKDVAPVANTSFMTEQDIDQAIANCIAARSGSSRRSISQLGRAYAAKAALMAAQGNASEARENMDRAISQWKVAEAKGSSAAMNFLGAYYGGTFNSSNVSFVDPPDFVKALGYWEAGAKLGNLRAARNAGSVLLQGDQDYPGTKQNIKDAVKLLDQAIQGGEPAAAGVLGRALYSNDPKGVGKDVKRGLELLATACLAGDQNARDFYDSPAAKQKQIPRPAGC